MQAPDLKAEGGFQVGVKDVTDAGTQGAASTPSDGSPESIGKSEPSIVVPSEPASTGPALKTGLPAPPHPATAPSENTRARVGSENELDEGRLSIAHRRNARTSLFGEDGLLQQGLYEVPRDFAETRIFQRLSRTW